MAITRRTVVDQIEINRSGAYQIRFALVIDEDGTEDEKRWHRTMVWNSGQVDATLAAVNVNLVAMKYAPLPQAAINRIKNIILAVEGVIGWKDPPPPPPQLLQLIGQNP